ncbi:hypothetical protein SAMN02983003_0932 [Devosia enhydra]|uniref:Uncharacterized protein n=1 Tax=Devosia enhydra TaxID=665118 RepID=A0A1K2HUX8_9HYPH|nr:hypothetical protein [Devosia enhydra]SFZ82195.1 hypothetical protein SAMN02983003_0932 [Devosia enhydra]
MRRLSDHIRPADVTLWGGIALGCWAAAVLAANVSALVPPSMLAGLHASRLDGGTLNQLRGQVAGLEADAARLRRETAALERRFDMTQQQAGTVTQRVGALESSIPRLLEALPKTAEIDRSALTASTDANGPQRFEAEGGSVVVRHSPLVPPAPLEMPIDGTDTQPLPAALESDDAATGDLGIAIGPAVDEAGAGAEWAELEARVGALLIGLRPVLGDGEAGDGRRIIAGPVAGETEATTLCTHLEMVAVTCAPAPYVGDPIAAGG